MKIRKSLYLEKAVYDEFRLYALMIDANGSKLIEEYMKNLLKKVKRKGA